MFVIDNKIEGTTNGVEAWATYQVSQSHAPLRRPAAAG
jgi:hypothetical protein